MSLFSLQAQWRSYTNAQIASSPWPLAGNCQITDRRSMGFRMWSVPTAPGTQNSKRPLPLRGTCDCCTHSMTRNSSARPAQCIYFAVKSSAYHNISKNVPCPSSATAGRTWALLHQWATTCRCTSSSVLLHQAEKDWAGLAHDSQPLFPGRDDLPEDLDEVLALMERDRHLPEVSDIPLPSMPLEPPPLTFLPLAAKLDDIPAAPRVPTSPALTPQGKLPSLAMTASDLLKTGSWPELCAGRVTGHRASLSKLPCLPPLSAGPLSTGTSCLKRRSWQHGRQSQSCSVGWMNQRGSSQMPVLHVLWTITHSWCSRDWAWAQSPKTRRTRPWVSFR